jgi:hypothetical protein
MQARGDPVTYEVRLEVDESIVAEVDVWLREHIVEMLRLPGFNSAEILDDAPLPVPADDKVRRTVQYQVESRDALTRYLREYAPKMREAGVKRFGDRMRATRRVLQPITTPVRSPELPVPKVATLPTETGGFAKHIEIPSAAAVRSCSNCQALLTGQYCAVCGQRDRNRMISLWELIVDFVGEFVNLDSRFWRTIFPLLFRPGRLTSEYLRGRRVHFTPPLRLYVISCFVFFLFATYGGIGESPIHVDDEEQEAAAKQTDESEKAGKTSGEAEAAARASDKSEAQAKASDEARSDATSTTGAAEPAAESEGISPTAPASTDASDAASPPGGDAADTDAARKGPHAKAATLGAPTGIPTEEEIERMVNEATQHAESNKGFQVGSERCTIDDFQTGNAFIDGPVRDRLKTACDHIAADNGKTFLRELVNNIPKMLFFFLPVIALAMKVLYFGSHRYYVEHLLFFVHVHSFIFVVLSVTLITSALKTQFPQLALMTGLTIAAVSIYIPYYLFRALRVVYGEGRLRTLAKYVLLFVTYLFGSSIVFAIGALLTALTV